MRKLTASILFVLTGLCAQTADAPTWKQFSIGPSTKGGSRFSRDGIQAEGIPLKRLLSRAYGVPEHRVVGPSWISGERYALTALVSNPADLQPLLQRELAARFYFLAHHETRDIPVLVLKSLDGAEPRSNPAPQPGAPRGPHPGLEMRQSTLTEFANMLSDVIERPVINETNIEGHYDLYLTWDNPGGIPAALKQQLGVQAVEERRPIDLLLIDRIERPRFN